MIGGYVVNNVNGINLRHGLGGSMKICDNWGYPNYSIKIKDKKPICDACKKPMLSTHQCRPTRKTSGDGQPREGETTMLKSEYD